MKCRGSLSLAHARNSGKSDLVFSFRCGILLACRGDAGNNSRGSAALGVSGWCSSAVGVPASSTLLASGDGKPKQYLAVSRIFAAVAFQYSACDSR